MKQPENYIMVVFDAGNNEYDVDIAEKGWIATGKTRQSAVKAAIRRLERLRRDCAKLLEGEK